MRSHLLFLLVSLITTGFVQSQETPRTVEETWALFDPRAEPLDTKIIRRWTEDGIALRHIRYVAGTFEGKKTRVAAFYAFPHRGKDLPAIDPRVRAASPSVGGSGYLYEDIRGIPGSARHMRADMDLYNRTVDCRSYWPLIRCPLLLLGATNDFNSPMEKVMQGFRSLPQPSGGLALAPHMNHRFTSEAYASRVRWFQAHLKGGFDFPATPASTMNLKTADGIPVFTVTPSIEGQPRRWITKVEIFYD